MPDPVGVPEEVGPWDVAQEVVREATTAAALQPRWWAAAWSLLGMATLVALATLQAPVIAYIVLLVIVLATMVCGGATPVLSERRRSAKGPPP